MSVAHPLRPVFVLSDDAAGLALRDKLAARDGWCALPSFDLLERMGRLLWGHEVGAGDAGISSLVDRPHLTSALRRLADALVSPAVPHGSAYAVGVIGRAELLGRYVRDVWPDSLVVAFGMPEVQSAVAAAEPDVWLDRAEVDADPQVVVERVADAAAQSVLDLPGPPETAHVVFAPERSPLHERVIVVLGAARSGTTWLHRLLSASPAVAGTATGETWLFPDVAPLWADEVRDAAGDDLTLAALRSFCDDLLSGLLRRSDPPATYVSEKTPTTVWQLSFVATLYPDAHYVHVVRDGRDAAMSLALTRGEDADLAGAAKEWVEAVGAIQSEAPRLARLHEVRYEDLLADPAAVVRDVWSWLGVAVTDEARETLDRRTRERITPLPATGEIGAGKWRSLPASDREVLEAVAGPLLRELGYLAGTS